MVLIGTHMMLPDFGVTDGALDFRLALIRQVARPDSLPVADWPMVAAQMLAAGADGVALAELAGEGPRSDSVVVRDLVDKAIEEIGLRKPALDAAIWCLTLVYCHAAAAGTITPKQTADVVVEMTLASETALQRSLFREFAQGFQWDDAPEYRPVIEAEWTRVVHAYNDRYGRTIGQSILSATTQGRRLVDLPFLTNDSTDPPVPMIYPTGFARRFLKWADAAGGAWANVDLESGQIECVDDIDPAVGARLLIDDQGIAPFWDRLRGEASGYSGKVPTEEAVISLLAVSIDEFLATNYEPAPRFFSIADILR